MTVRFVDASVFVHAYLTPRRALKPHEVDIKRRAREIVARINEGEPVVLSSVHLAEVANLLEDWMTREDAHAVERGLLTRDTVTILDVRRHDLTAALDVAQEKGAGLTDSLAVVLMRREALREVYSFDKDFDVFDDVKRIAT